VIPGSFSGAVVKQLLFSFSITDHDTKQVFVTVFYSSGMELSLYLYVNCMLNEDICRLMTSPMM